METQKLIKKKKNNIKMLFKINSEVLLKPHG